MNPRMKDIEVLLFIYECEENNQNAQVLLQGEENFDNRQTIFRLQMMGLMKHFTLREHGRKVVTNYLTRNIANANQEIEMYKEQIRKSILVKNPTHRFSGKPGRL